MSSKSNLLHNYSKSNISSRKKKKHKEQKYGYEIKFKGPEYQLIQSRPFKDFGEDSLSIVKNRLTLHESRCTHS